MGGHRMVAAQGLVGQNLRAHDSTDRGGGSEGQDHKYHTQHGKGPSDAT